MGPKDLKEYKPEQAWEATAVDLYRDKLVDVETVGGRKERGFLVCLEQGPSGRLLCIGIPTNVVKDVSVVIPKKRSIFDIILGRK